jgi:hypothetical protein
MTTADDYARWQRDAGLTRPADREPGFDTECDEFLARLRDFVRAGNRLAEVWDGDEFHADEWAPLPDRLRPPASLDEWLADLAGHYEDAVAHDRHDAELAARLDRECGADLVYGPPEDPYGSTCERLRGHDGQHVGPDALGARGDLVVWTDRPRFIASLVPDRDRGAYYDRRDPGVVGSLFVPMLADGRPDVEQVGVVEVRWEDA